MRREFVMQYTTTSMWRYFDVCRMHINSRMANGCGLSWAKTSPPHSQVGLSAIQISKFWALCMTSSHHCSVVLVSTGSRMRKPACNPVYSITKPKTRLVNPGMGLRITNLRVIANLHDNSGVVGTFLHRIRSRVVSSFHVPLRGRRVVGALSKKKAVLVWQHDKFQFAPMLHRGSLSWCTASISDSE